MASIKNIPNKARWIFLSICILAVLLILLRSSNGSSKNTDKQTYLIGRDSSWYPLALSGKERNLVAFTNELFNEISKESGLKFHLIESSPSLLLPGLDRGDFDAIISSLRPTVVNSETYLFSELFFEIGPVLMVKKSSSINSLKEAHGHILGIVSDSPLVFNSVRETGANIYQLSFVFYSNVNKALEALMNNYIDGIILGALPAYTLSEGYHAGSLKIVTLTLTDEGIKLITLKKASFSFYVIEQFNKALNTLKSNGTYHALVEKWNLIDPEKNFR